MGYWGLYLYGETPRYKTRGFVKAPLSFFYPISALFNPKTGGLQKRGKAGE